MSTTTDHVSRLYQSDWSCVVDGHSLDTAGMKQPPPAHCHAGVLDAKLTSGQWTQQPGCHDDEAGAPAVAMATGSAEALRSLDVLYAAAVLRSEMREPSLTDGVTSSVTSPLNGCPVSHCDDDSFVLV